MMDGRGMDGWMLDGGMEGAKEGGWLVEEYMDRWMEGEWIDSGVKARFCLPYVCSVFLKLIAIFVSQEPNSTASAE